MATLLVGANPGVRLFADGQVTAFASLWRVDWSVRGAGAAIVLWHAGVVRLLTTDADLGRWLERDFTRHFPEVDSLAWTEPEPEVCEVDVSVDLTHGVRATGGDVRVDPGDRPSSSAFLAESEVWSSRQSPTRS